MQNSSFVKNSNSNTITYRNAIYQGNIDFESECRTKFGIVYLAKTHQFICCKNWQYDRLSGQSIFFNSDQRYSYGYWLNNRPHGFNVFRIDQTLIFLEFKNGKIQKNSKIIVFYEKYNLALILIVTNEKTALQHLQLEIYNKSQIFSSEDLYELFRICKWPAHYFIDGETLIRFISNKIISQNNKNKSSNDKTNPIKLRLLSNKYYRFGYDQGLALVFNENYQRISVGIHSKAILTSYGISFNHQNSQLFAEQGLFDKNKLFTIPSKGQSIVDERQLNKVYSNNLLTSVNFSNSFYRNISKPYQSAIQYLLANDSLLREQIKGYTSTQKLINEQTLKFSKIQTKIDQSQSKQLLFTQTHQNINKDNIKSGLIYKNQILNDRLRLQKIKKQIYGSIERKNIISKNQYPQNGLQSSKNIIGKVFKIRKDQFTLFEPDRQNPRLLQTPQKTIQKSKSRKKIFQEQNKNIKILNDFTPYKQQKNLTPFKAKMKNRIFDLNYTSKQHPRSNYTESRFNSNDPQEINKNKEQLKISQQSKLKLRSQKRDVYLSESDLENNYKHNSKKQQSKDLKRSKNVQYVPINPIEQKLKKKNLTLNQRNMNSSREQFEQSHNKNNYEPVDQESINQNNHSYKLIYSESKKGLVNKNDNKNICDKEIKKSPKSTNKNGKLTQEKRKSFHKHSNDIYLNVQQKNPGYYDQKSYPNRKAYDNSYQVHSPIKYEMKTSAYKNSYMKKYENKKQIDKSIQRSPDRFRCYGKDLQHSYLQKTQFDNKKNYTNQKSYERGIYLQESPAKSYYNESLSFARQKKQKFF